MTDADRTLIEARDPLEGMVVGDRYRVDFRIAVGGFGAVYHATDLLAGVPVAIKAMHRSLAFDPRMVARFRREGAALARLSSPHTIRAYDLGDTPDGRPYIVLELLEGESLYERFKSGGPLPWQRVVAIARAVCSSLAEAHALGIVHRDLKPENIHLEPGGMVKVLDFGIAKVLDSSSGDLTLAGQMIGTFDYMPPEQMIGGDTTGRTDVFALGIVMYEMICGARPFEGNGPASLLAAVLGSTPAPLLARVAVPPALDHIILRCIAREPEDRCDITEVAAALDALLSPLVDDDDPTYIGPQPVAGSRTPEARPPRPTLVGVTPTSLRLPPVSPKRFPSGTNPIVSRRVETEAAALPAAPRPMWPLALVILGIALAIAFASALILSMT